MTTLDQAAGLLVALLDGNRRPPDPEGDWVSYATTNPMTDNRVEIYVEITESSGLCQGFRMLLSFDCLSDQLSMPV